MSNSIFNQAIKATKATNGILAKAGSKMFQSSFSTAKKIAVLYKDAGLETYKIGKKVVSSTVELAVSNQKELLQTSGEAIREAAQSIRKTDLKASPKKTAKKSPKRKKKAALTIDDVL